MERRTQMEHIAGLFRGYNATLLIDLCVKQGVFAALTRREGWTGADALAAELGLHPPYTEHLLRAAYALDLLERHADGRYRLAPHVDTLLGRPESSGYLGALAELQVVAARDVERMPALLKSGEVHPYQDHDDDFIAAVDAATAGIARFVAGRVVPSLPELSGRRDAAVLDLGCGSGGALVALAGAFPDGRVVGVDVEPRSVERAARRIREAGLEDRAEARLAGAEHFDEPGGFDLVTLIQVLHETREAVRADVLARAYEALRPGGLLLLVDEPYPDDLHDLPEVAWTALQQWIEIFWGNVFLSPEQQRRMLEDAGFEVVSQDVVPPGLVCATVARRPGSATRSRAKPDR